MAVWSIVKVSQLYRGKRLGAEFYHPDKLRALMLLRSRSSESIQDSFANVRKILNPSKAAPAFTVPTLLFDLSDIEAHFLGDGLPVGGCSEVGSAKKIFKAGDVLISRLRPYLREIAFADQESGMLLGSTEFIVLREKKGSRVPAEFLFVFLMTKDVQDVLLWSQEGTNHPRFPESVLLDLPLPTPDGSTTTRVTELVRTANRAFRESRRIYVQAERMVLEEISWDKFCLSQPKWWTVPLSRARGVHRLDAEHFQPKYDKLIAHLKKTGKAKPLGEVAPFINHGPQPPYSEIQEVPVITQRHMGRYLLNFESPEEFTTKDFWQSKKKFQVRKQDILYYSVGAYLGRTNLYLSNIPAMAGSYITIIRPNTEECLPEYLAVYLNSPPGQMQSDRHSRASGQQYIYPPDIAQFLVYRPSHNFQQQVADMVRQSYQARQKAKSLLEEAKATVEALIEGVNNKVNFP